MTEKVWVDRGEYRCVGGKGAHIHIVVHKSRVDVKSPETKWLEFDC